MLSKVDIIKIGAILNNLNLPYRFGYAGSYVRGTATKRSDIDIVLKNAKNINLDEYMKVYNCLQNYLKSFKVKFDIVNLDCLFEEDRELDSLSASMGFGSNENSAYKNIQREVLWFE